MLSESVFEGIVDSQSTPIAGLIVQLFCSFNPYPTSGDPLFETQTEETSWYGLSTYELSPTCEFYPIRPQTLAGFLPTGATSVDGAVQQSDWIQYSVDQLADTRTGNKFWQDTSRINAPLIVR